MNTKSHLKLRALTEGAIFAAAALVLNYIKFFELPWGGSINLEMLPIFIYCARWGFGPGILMSFVFSLVQLLMGGNIFAMSVIQVFADYIVAFTILGLAGLFHNMKGGFFIGTAVGSLGRFLSHYVAGATVWAEYMPEEFLGMTMTSPWIYSAIYNCTYMLPNMLLCMLVTLLLWKPLKKFITGEDLKKA